MNAFIQLIRARNIEFMRDKAALGWSLLFPLMLIIALAVMFDKDDVPLYRIGVVGEPASLSLLDEYRYLNIIHYDQLAKAEQQIARHRIDLLVTEHGYSINPDNRAGYFLEQLLLAKQADLERHDIAGRAVSHVEWYLPGIISMNIMFSALFGVGYVIIRYRRTGVLRRMQVTPLSAWQFLSSQLFSRLLAIVGTAAVVFLVIMLLFSIPIRGNPLLLLLSTTIGAAAMIAIGLMVACRTRSDELGNGVLNLISWPMMMMSEIWFSLEGSSPWLQFLSKLLPLTHMNAVNRAIISDGAGLLDVAPQLGMMICGTTICTGIACLFFKWD